MGRPTGYLIILGIVVNIINLSPVLDSPYLGDDSWRESCLAGVMSLTGSDFWDISWGSLKDYVQDGRWYPLVIFYYLVFYHLDLFQYKLGVIALIILNLLLMGFLSQILTKRKTALFLVLLLSPVFFQIRFYHDPILSYYYLMQLEFLLIQLSLISFIKAIRENRVLYLSLSVMAYLATLLIYEAFYPFVLIYALVAYVELNPKQPSDIIKWSLPFLAVALFNLGIALSIRMYFRTSYAGTTISFDVLALSQTFLKQLFCAMPFSYILTTGGNFIELGEINGFMISSIVLLSATWTCAWMLTWKFFFRNQGHEAPSNLKRSLVLGMALFVLPAIVVSLAAKYQSELKWGIGYLPSYISAFGLLTILTAIVLRLATPIQKLSRPLTHSILAGTSVVGVALISLNFLANSMVIGAYNLAEHYPREFIENALRHGFLRNVPENSFVAFGYPLHSWDNPAFYKMHSGLTLQIVKPQGFDMDAQLGVMSYREAFEDYAAKSNGEGDFYDFSIPKDSLKAFTGYSLEFKKAQGVTLNRRIQVKPVNLVNQSFFLKYDAQSRDFGYAVLGKIERLRVVEGSDVTAISARAQIYVKAAKPDGSARIKISGRRMGLQSLEFSEAFVIDESNLKLLVSDGDSKLFELVTSVPSEYIDLASLEVKRAPRSP